MKHQSRLPSAATRRSEDTRRMAGSGSAAADKAPADENRVDKADCNALGRLAGAAAASENGSKRVSVTDSRRPTPEEAQEIERLTREGMAPRFARAEVLGRVEEELRL
jgi:hypothetical protein